MKAKSQTTFLSIGLIYLIIESLDEVFEARLLYIKRFEAQRCARQSIIPEKTLQSSHALCLPGFN
jgi:hypothetical protein